MAPDPKPSRSLEERIVARLHARRLFRRALPSKAKVAAFACMALAVIAAVLADGRAVRLVLESAFSAACGGSVSVARFSWTGWGSARLEDIRLHATGPEWAGRFGEVAYLESMEVRVDVLPILVGAVHIRDLTAKGLRLTPTEHPDTAQSSLAALSPRTGGGLGSLRIERATLTDAEASVLRLAGIMPMPVATFRFTASISPKADVSGESMVTLEGVDSPLRLEGTIDQRTLSLDASLTGFSVTEDLIVCLPRSARLIAEQVDPSGTLEEARVRWSREAGLWASARVSSCEATAPDLGLRNQWVRLDSGRVVPTEGAPRVRIERATVRLDRNQLAVEGLVGSLISSLGDRDDRVGAVPIAASLQIDLTDSLLREFEWSRREEWLQELLDIAPFELGMRIDGFAVGGRGAAPAVELPSAVAEFFGYFNLRQCKFDFEADIARGHPTVGPDGGPAPGTVTTRARLALRDTAGAFDEFPYLLEDVHAIVTFQDLNARIEELRGRGSGNAEIAVSGDIRPAGDSVAVDLRISGTDVQIDDRLIGAFDSGARAMAHTLLSRANYEGLRRAGLIHSSLDMTQLERDLRAAEAELAAMQAPGADAPPDRLAQAAVRAASLRRQLSLGPFDLGGEVDFAVRITHDGDDRNLAAVEGTIHTGPIGIVPADFAYAAVLDPARITLSRDRVSLGDGIPFRTPGGGRGLIGGTVDILEQDAVRRFGARIEFSLEGEPIGTRLFAATPPSRDDLLAGWPGERLSEVGRILDSLRLRGMLSARGSITTEPGSAAPPRVLVEARLSDGAIQPNPSVSESSPGIFWPAGFALTECDAAFTIDDQWVRLDEFRGRRKSGTVRAQGRASLDTGAVSARVSLDNISLGEYAVNLVPYESRSQARALWERYQPRGIFSATLDLERDGQTGQLDSLVVIQPRTFGLNLPRGPVEFRCADGAVIVSPRAVTIEGLLGVFGPPTAPATGICLEGSYGIDDGVLQCDGDLKGMTLGSPVLPELLRILDAEQHQVTLDDLSPEGTFDASFAVLSGGGAPDELAFTASTEQMSIGPPDLRLDLVFDPPLQVRSDRGFTSVSAPKVRYRGGTLSFDAWVQSGPGTAPLSGDASISVDSVGPAPELLAAMPAEARAPLQSIDFGWTGGLSAQGVRLAIGEDARGPAIDMRGRFSLRGGTIDAGPQIRSINAAVDVDLRARAQGTAFAIAAEGSRASVSGRHVDAFSVRMLRPSPESDILVGPVTASVGGGVLELHGAVRDRDLSPERPPWEIEASMAGCSLAALVLRDDLEPGAPVPSPDSQPGTVAGRLTVAGTSGGGRAGSGGVTLRDARLAEVPVGLALLQLTQLMLPLNASLNRAETRFSLVDDEIHFDELEAECSTLILSGRGSMDLSTGALALRLRNRGTLPIVSDIVGGLMEQVFQIDVRGTLEAPEASIAPIPAIAPMPTLADQSPPDRGQVP